MQRWAAVAFLWLALHSLGPCGVQAGSQGLSRLEQEEILFMRSSLMREIEQLGSAAAEDGADPKQAQENVIRRAYRNIARRYKRNVFADSAKFEFQMRILNLARDALVQGETAGAGGWGSGGEDGGNETAAGPGRELPLGSRASEEILKQMYSWQEYCLEEGVRFDDPDAPYFVGHTQHGYRAAFAANWTAFVRGELASLWPAAANLKLQVELSPGGGGDRARVRRLAEAERQVARDAVAAVAGLLYACGARDTALAGPLPSAEDAEAWVELHLRVSRNARSLLGGGQPGPGCAEWADAEARVGALEACLEVLEQLGGEEGDGRGRADVALEVREVHAAVAQLRSEAAASERCRQVAALKRGALERLWDDYQFGLAVKEAYPVDACALPGLAAFLEFHVGPNGELLEQRAEPDRTMLRALRSLHVLQRALVQPSSFRLGHWRESVGHLEDAVWQGVAFPELHEAVGRLMGEVANAGLLPEVLEAVLEHPPVQGGAAGATLRHGREPSDVQFLRQPRFLGLSVPGYSLKPLQRYEERALHLWGNEEVEERWDPVRLGLAYIDLTPACDLPLQVAMCFVSAALWFWRALQLLGDNCGGDGWLDEYIFEDLWGVPAESKRLAMQFALKRAVYELVDYASLMAESQLLPGGRLVVQRAGYNILRKVAARFGTEDDAPRLLTQLRRTLAAARLNPVWAPPLLLVSDAVFVDILALRLHQSYMEVLHEGPSGASVLPSAVPEYTLFEAALLGAGDTTNVTYARFELMEALLRDTGRTWDEVESAFAPSPLALDPAGFAAGRSPGLPAPAALQGAEFAAVLGVRVDMATGRASLLLQRPSIGGGAESRPLLALDDLLGILAVADPGPMHLSLDPPREAGAGIANYPHHPFQRAVAGPAGVDRRAELALLHAALAVQQVAAGTEVAQRAPFAARRCSQGLCRGLPSSAVRDHLQPVAGLRGEPWDVPARLVLECARLAYRQSMQGSLLEVRFGAPAVEVHDGTPLRKLNEEEFKTWPVERLRQALRRVRAEQEDLPALEKRELVEQLVRALESGSLLEDEDEQANPLARFARRFTHHLPAVAAHWHHLGRLAPLCALRAAGMVLRLQVEQLRAGAEEQRESLRASARAHAAGVRREQADAWRAMLAEVHAESLRDLGFVDFDPGGCWGGGGGERSFARCCSVGDHFDECWGGLEGQPATEGSPSLEALRCCGGGARRGGLLSPPVLASIAGKLGSASPRRPRPEELIPAVSAWLQHPWGRGPDGAAFSAAVVAQLAEEVPEDDAFLTQAEEQLSRPAEHLQAALAALKPAESARFASGPKEAWLPVPTLATAAGRRALYVTVALAPQLVQEDELAGGGDGGMEELGLDDLPRLARAAERSGGPAEVAVGGAGGDTEAPQEAAELLHALHGRTLELEEGGQPAEGGLDAAAAPEDSGCSADGWRELPADELRASPRARERVRVRRRGSDDTSGGELLVAAKVAAVADGDQVVHLWQSGGDQGGGQPPRYADLSDAALAVAVPCAAAGPTALGLVEGNTTDGPGAGESPWPTCILLGLGWPSSNGSGLFVNLEALGQSEGCFRGDCSHSDHFACPSPAECARVCARLAACRWWTFWEAAPSTCWLRGAAASFESRQDARGAVSGSRRCVPPGDAGGGEATLFELVLAATGTPHPELRQEWDLVQVLEQFGHMTAEAARRAWPSPLQGAALRVAGACERAQRCAVEGRGCAADRAPGSAAGRLQGP